MIIVIREGDWLEILLVSLCLPASHLSLHTPPMTTLSPPWQYLLPLKCQPKRDKSNIMLLHLLLPGEIKATFGKVLCFYALVFTVPFPPGGAGWDLSCVHSALQCPAPVSKPDTTKWTQVNTLIIYNCALGFSTWLPLPSLCAIIHCNSSHLSNLFRQFTS